MSLTIDTNFPIDPSSIDLSVAKPLVTLLLENLNFPIYKLNPVQQSAIALFIQHTPAAFDTLKDNIIKITADGKIDLHEIPLIIHLLADTYHIYSVNNALLQEDNIIVFIQYTIQLLLDYHFVYLPYAEREIIESVINTGIALLRMNIIDKGENKGCFSFLLRKIKI